MCVSVCNQFCQLKPQPNIVRLVLIWMIGKMVLTPSAALGLVLPRALPSEIRSTVALTPAALTPVSLLTSIPTFIPQLTSTMTVPTITSRSALITSITPIHPINHPINRVSTIVAPPTGDQFGSPRRCEEQPSGLGFPGFPLGSSRATVEAMLGVPADEFQGYWGDTTALVYYLIPGQVSLGLLFDRQSQQLQQTEASFALSIGIDVVFETLDTMLGCRLDDTIRAGVRQVWSNEIRSYRFSRDVLRGVVEWETADRLYIGIWLSSLHDY